MMWPSKAEVLAAKDAYELTMPTWEQPTSYALGVEQPDGTIDWRVINHPNTHELPAVVLGLITGHRAGTATRYITPAQLDHAIAMLEPAGACDTWDHPNLWGWQKLKASLDAEPLTDGQQIVIVFLATDAQSSDRPQQELLAAIGLRPQQG